MAILANHPQHFRFSRLSKNGAMSTVVFPVASPAAEYFTAAPVNGLAACLSVPRLAEGADETGPPSTGKASVKAALMILNRRSRDLKKDVK